MTAPNGLVVESVEGLAEALHERFAPDYMDHWADLDEDEKRRTEAWDMAQALIASGAVRPAAEVRAEALREAADALDAMWNRGHDDSVHPNSHLLRERAALAEEGGR